MSRMSRGCGSDGGGSYGWEWRWRWWLGVVPVCFVGGGGDGSQVLVEEEGDIILECYWSSGKSYDLGACQFRQRDL